MRQKKLMRASQPISDEGRLLLSFVLVLLIVVIVGITFVLKTQEAQGQMLNHVMKQTEQIQATLDELNQAELSDSFIGTFTATAYCAGFGDGCSVCGTNGITAKGTKCSPMGSDLVTIAVDPRIIPYGTKLKIIYPDGSIVFGLAEDTGGFAQGLYPVKQIDICCANHEEALAMGVEQVKVYELKGE